MNGPLQRSPLHELAAMAGAHLSAIAGWEVVRRYPNENPETDLFAAGRGVAMADESANGKLLVEGRQAGTFLHTNWGVPELAPGDGFATQQTNIYRLRTDQFLVHTAPGFAQEIAGRLTTLVQPGDPLITVTDITHGRSEILLIGPDSTGLLSRLCSLNFDGQQFPAGTVRQSSVAKTRQIIIRADMGLYPAFRLIGDRSLAVYLWQTIKVAGQDLDLIPIGRETLDTLD